MSEATALGAALAAGRAVGVWAQPSLLPVPPTSAFTPSIGHDGECSWCLGWVQIWCAVQLLPLERDVQYKKWKEAVRRCMHWHGSETRSSMEKRGRLSVNSPHTSSHLAFSRFQQFYGRSQWAWSQGQCYWVDCYWQWRAFVRSCELTYENDLIYLALNCHERLYIAMNNIPNITTGLTIN